MDKRLANGAHTRDAVLEAAVELVSRHGVAGMTAGKLAHAAGISKSNVFHHFPSTRLIPAALLEHVGAKLMEVVEPSGRGSVEEVLDALSDDLFSPPPDRKKLHTALLAFFHEGVHADHLRRSFTELLRNLVDQLTARFVSCRDVTTDRRRIEECARLILTVLDGFGLHLLAVTDSDEYVASWRLCKTMIIHTLTDTKEDA